MLTDVVSLASRLVRFDTANPPGGEAACLEYLAGGLAEAGFAVHLDSFGPGRVSLVARLHPDAPQSGLCLAGHIDTVPLGRAEWRVDPLAGEVRNGRLHGRGASDMKGGIAAMVAAAVSLAPRLPADRDLVPVHIRRRGERLRRLVPRRRAAGAAGRPRRRGHRRAHLQPPAGRAQGRALAEGRGSGPHGPRLHARARRQRALQGA